MPAAQTQAQTTDRAELDRRTRLAPDPMRRLMAAARVMLGALDSEADALDLPTDVRAARAQLRGAVAAVEWAAANLGDVA